MNDYLEQDRRSATANRLAYIACLVAFAALAAAVLFGFNPHLRENAGSDFKTLYASTWCFVHGIDAYQFPNLAQVFHQNDVIEPRSWYGHSPVYPPLTLALLAPLTLIPMVPAIDVWIVLGCASVGLATATLLHAAGERYALGFAGKLVLIACAAASPLLEIGLELANVSVVSASLSVFAVAAPASVNVWLRALALTIALLLKPHIAFWVALAFLFSSVRQDRATLWRTALLTGAFVLLYAGWSVAHHYAFQQFGSYRQIVISELSNGSMSPGNQDVMEVFVQITSLSSLLGYWLWQHPVASPLTPVLLLIVGGTLAYACWKLRDAAQSRMIENAAAWSAFGLLATYHRDADAMIMMLVLPSVLGRLRSNRNDMWAWSVLGAVLLASVGPSIRDLHILVDAAPSTNLYRFLLLRQASIAIAILNVLLTAYAWTAMRRQQHPASKPLPA